MFETMRNASRDAAFEHRHAADVEQHVVTAPDLQRRHLHFAEAVVERMIAPLGRDDPEDRVELIAIFEAVGVKHRFRSEDHTSELQSLMRISYAVFCLKKKNT